MKIETVDFKTGKTSTFKNGKLGNDGKRWFLWFDMPRDWDNGFKLNAIIKKMPGYKFYGFEGAQHQEYVIEVCGTDKVWSVPINARTNFTISYLKGEDPYEFWRQPLEEVDFDYPLKPWQVEQARFFYTRRLAAIGSGMGLGKTLAAIATWEKVRPDSLIYVGPKLVLEQTELIELPKWSPRIKPDAYYNYEYFQKKKKFKHLLKDPPQMLICDEAHALKNSAALQTRGVAKLVQAMRDKWGSQAYVGLMSGSFAPQSPIDYWSPADILCPGFLIEGDSRIFMRRMAVMETRNEGNGDFKEVLTWKDRDGIPNCTNCGVLRENHSRDNVIVKAERCRGFTKTVNEVLALNSRLSGKLFLFQASEDYLDLPPLERVKVQCPVNQESLDLARGFSATSPSGSDLLSKACQISDGFLYEDEVTGKKVCTDCEGSGSRTGLVPRDPENIPPLELGVSEEDYMETYFHEGKMQCDLCRGYGQEDIVRRKVEYFGSPKEDELRKLLAEHDDRLVAYGAFQGSVDIMTKVAAEAGWNWIRADGRGWATSWETDVSPLIHFQSREYDSRKLIFIGQPGAAGSGLNLQASPSVIYYSNDFNAKNRIQSEKRVHRYGSEFECIRSFDLFHLPTDLYVLNKVEIKRSRMDLSAGLNVDMNEVLALLGVSSVSELL